MQHTTVKLLRAAEPIASKYILEYIYLEYIVYFWSEGKIEHHHNQ